jgi:RNA polymerase sigma-70 factor, ECF subfamily
MMQTDERLLLLVAQGNETAFDRLYDRHYHTVVRLVLRMVRSEDLAEDIAQEVFLRVWQKGAQWDGRGIVRNWICKIATNISLNYIETANRRALRHVPIHQRDAEEDAFYRMADTMTQGPDETYFRKVMLHDLETSVAQLSEGKREVVNMLLKEDATLSDISERLGVPLGTVKSRIFYASRELRDKLQWNREVEK